MLKTFLSRAYWYHALNPGGGCLPYLVRYFSTVCRNVVDLPLSYSLHFWSASFINPAIGCRSTIGGDATAVATSCRNEVRDRDDGILLDGVCCCGRPGIVTWEIAEGTSSPVRKRRLNINIKTAADAITVTSHR